MERCNLATRKSDGIHVALNWYPAENTVEVVVSEPMGDGLVIYPPNDRALDAFYHPYAYAPEPVPA